VKCAQQYFFQ